MMMVFRVGSTSIESLYFIPLQLPYITTAYTMCLTPLPFLLLVRLLGNSSLAEMSILEMSVYVSAECDSSVCWDKYSEEGSKTIEAAFLLYFQIVHSVLLVWGTFFAVDFTTRVASCLLLLIGCSAYSLKLKYNY